MVGGLPIPGPRLGPLLREGPQGGEGREGEGRRRKTVGSFSPPVPTPRATGGRDSVSKERGSKITTGARCLLTTQEDPGAGYNSPSTVEGVRTQSDRQA